MESLKYDLQEKTDLLREAGLALEDLENRISTLTIEREEERSRLETRLSQMEDDLNDSVGNVFKEIVSEELQNHQGGGEDKKATPDLRDDDETLLREVEAEIARGVSSPTKKTFSTPTKSLLLPLDLSGGADMFAATSTPSRPSFLDVVQENENEIMVERLQEYEAKNEELNRALTETEEELKEVSVSSSKALMKKKIIETCLNFRPKRKCSNV